MLNLLKHLKRKGVYFFKEDFMKKIYLSLIAIFLLGLACSKIPDTISKFQDGINNNDYLKVAETISKDANDYNSLSNNDWSGLKDQIQNWRSAGDYTFSSVPESASSSPADINCSVKNDNGSFNCYFQMEKSGIFPSWKIMKWKIDSDNNGSYDTSYILVKNKK